MSVNIKPLPEFYRRFPRKYRPGHPPVFEGSITEQDIRLAIELYDLLDKESQSWYYREGGIFPHPDSMPMKAPRKRKGLDHVDHIRELDTQ